MPRTYWMILGILILSAIGIAVALFLWPIPRPSDRIIDLIHVEVAGDVVLEKKLMAIYAGESEHQDEYDSGDGGTSFGPFQLHHPGLADQFTKETGLDPKKEETI